MSDKNWPGLGFCPAPGDLEAIAKMYADVDAVANELAELRHALAGIGAGGGAWEGEAARNFASRLGQLPKYLTQGHDSMAACSRALKTWHTQLSAMVAAGRAMESEAVELRSRLSGTDDQLVALARTLDSYRQAGAQQPADNVMMRTEKQWKAALEASQSGHHQLDQLISRAHKQLDDHRHKAEAAARAITEASRHHPPDPGLFKRLLDEVEHAWQKSKDFLADHADTLSRISAGLAIAALALSWVPGAAPVLGGAAALTSLAAGTGHGIAKARGQDVSWLSIGLDGLGAIPGFGAVKGFATAGRTAARVEGGGNVVTKVARDFANDVKASKGAGGVERAKGAGAGVFQMTANPLSTKGIMAGLRKANIEVDPRAVTLPVKTGGLAFGLAEDRKRGQEVRAPRPLRPSPEPFLSAVS
ncbi:hypothetical protein [Streptomyces rubellomurinus]|uniref:hypothetical protein n=1 Tax=Streptomyces rubellomurinus (strain ATCC 31215) TaxID=359131 RepID=UPI000697EAE3|nr:hypothetical protein [Streptomyces rubellomurinus]